MHNEKNKLKCPSFCCPTLSLNMTNDNIPSVYFHVKTVLTVFCLMRVDSLNCRFHKSLLPETNHSNSIVMDNLKVCTGSRYGRGQLCFIKVVT